MGIYESPIVLLDTVRASVRQGIQAPGQNCARPIPGFRVPVDAGASGPCPEHAYPPSVHVGFQHGAAGICPNHQSGPINPEPCEFTPSTISGREAGPVTLTLAAKQTTHLNSGDLENGAPPSKRLSGTIGSGQGNWRLKLETDLDIEPLAYIRTSDGFLTAIHDVAQGESMRWYVPIFNPGSNSNQKSSLRVINTSGIETEVEIEGLDDGGALAGDEVRFTLPADAARLYTAQELESGHSDFDGSLGTGTRGKWQLFVSANRPIQVMSLMSTPAGHITNLSSTTGDAIIRGGPGGDELWGGNDDDIFDPGDNATSSDLDVDRGHDTVHGSMGDDMVIYSRSGAEAFQEIRYSDPDAGDYLNAGITATIDGAANTATVDKGLRRHRHDREHRRSIERQWLRSPGHGFRRCLQPDHRRRPVHEHHGWSRQRQVQRPANRRRLGPGRLRNRAYRHHRGPERRPGKQRWAWQRRYLHRRHTERHRRLRALGRDPRQRPERMVLRSPGERQHRCPRRLGHVVLRV